MSLSSTACGQELLQLRIELSAHALKLAWHRTPSDGPRCALQNKACLTTCLVIMLYM